MQELTTIEVGKRLGRSDSAVRRWVRLGLLAPARIVGGSYVVPVKAVDRFTPPRKGRPRSVKP